ncbi:patatin-like phospholipase family protein [Actinomycetospora endophytica]|uniref:Patatin-like phospholipase family protein n=1 Tax=Actinomycetospora endophytica TaxID=2291215 RepID=A0ABS8PKG3_9PSEU|nr:patatin-like phospholipase family protein [Actinomycetospora endophytica]MCD2197469.1 patatin-like phospholipase family protein [Actinomycetospora endophytica]
MSRTPSRRAVVLGTGGSLGYAWTVAALSTWQQATGLDARDADVVVGTSAGSIVASALASGLAVEDLVDHLLDAPSRPSSNRKPRRRGARGGLPPMPRIGPGSVRLLGRIAQAPTKFPPLAAASALLPVGRADTSGVVRLVSSFASETWPAPPDGPELRIVATDYDSGARVPFGRAGAPPTSPAEAASASCAVPGWFAPVRIAGRRYVDGGVCSATSADLLLGPDMPPLDEALVLIPLARRGRMQLGGAGAAADGLFRGIVGGRSAREIGRLRTAGLRVTAHAPGPEDRAAMGWNVMDARKQGDVLRTALRTTAAWWARKDRGRTIGEGHE